MQIRAAQTAPASVWPSLTSSNNPKVSARQYLTFMHNKPNAGASCRVLIAPGGFGGGWRYQHGWGRQDRVSWAGFGVVGRPIPLSELLLASCRIQTAPGGVQGGGMWPWVRSEMFYSGCLSSKEHFPFRLNYVDSVYSKHRRQDSSISSFRKHGWVYFLQNL